MGRKVAGIGFLLAIVGVFVSAFPAFANHTEEVLGISTESSAPLIPPVADGPGLILPDNPLFFLDELKQKVRVLLAVNSLDKAAVYSQIAGERLAELRYMLARKNREGIRIDLDGISENTQKAADELAAAQFAGLGVERLAKQLTITLKERQKVLDTLESIAKGEIKQRAVFAKFALLEAKLKIEDALPQDERAKEYSLDLQRNGGEKSNVLGTQKTATPSIISSPKK